jgi:transposase
MFLRRNRREHGGELYEYWTLVESVRTARGPRQRVVATLGKLPSLDHEEQRGWEEIARLLDGREAGRQAEFFESGSQGASSGPQWAEVDLRGLRVERVREFGNVYLGLALWRRLGLHELLGELIESGREEIAWEQIACLLTIARFCAQRSELGIAERWFGDTALEDLLGVQAGQINDDRLYRGLDVLQTYKDRLCAHLLERYQSWFGVGFEFLLYDLTSTFFEGEALRNQKAARGYSRDGRPDCKQVCIGIVVTPEGLPISYEVFAGNRADVTTIEEIVTIMEDKYGQARRIWVLDRGMISEENVEFLRSRQARYVVGTPKAQLKGFEQQLLEEEDWHQVQPGVEVKLVVHPDGDTTEQFILCRSRARRQKEGAMLELQRQRLLAKLQQLNRSLAKHPRRDAGAVERRIGRWLGRYPAAEKLLDVQVERNGQGHAAGLEIVQRGERSAWAEHAHGAYLLRTNCSESDPVKLWRWYIQLQQAEAAFRTSKNDLALRPLYHQKTERVDAHILVCFLALALWRTLEMWMRSKGLGTCARQLLLEVSTIRSMDVILPVKNRGQLRLRVVARPDQPVAQLLAHLGLALPTTPKIIQNVVEKIA